MKTLRGLDSKPQLLEEVTDPKALAKVFTFRQLFKMVIGGTTAANGDESIDLTQIGLKLKGGGDISLEEADFKLIQKKVEGNEAKLTAMFQGQLLLKLKDAEKEDAPKA